MKAEYKPIISGHIPPFSILKNLRKVDLHEKSDSNLFKK